MKAKIPKESDPLYSYIRTTLMISSDPQIQNILIDKEIYWKQRSRTDWLKEGDKNTKFFHYKVSSKKKKNRIWGIETDAGKWVAKAEEVGHEFCNYFTKLFTTSKPSHD